MLGGCRALTSGVGGSACWLIGMTANTPAIGEAHYANLDIVRACAALAVLAGHAYLLSGTFLNPADLRPDHLLITNSGVGVWLFFALSGYLIAGPYLRALIDGRPLPVPRVYAVRRVARIFPAYLIAFAIASTAPTTAITHWWQWPLHVTLLHNLIPGE